MLPISGNKNEMSLAETYFLATRARSKLAKAASKHDHDLRVLVAHANLLDSVMDTLAEKRRLEKSLLKDATANKEETVELSVTFEDNDEEEEEEFYDSDSDSDSDSDEEEDEDFDDSRYRNITHIPFGSNKRDFRTLPTVDEDVEDLPSLSYSSDEEEEDEELAVIVKTATAAGDLQNDQKKLPEVNFQTPRIVTV